MTELWDWLSRLYSFSDKQGTTGIEFNRFNVRAPFSDLAVFGSDGLAACGEVEEGVVAEEVGCFLLKQLAMSLPPFVLMSH